MRQYFCMPCTAKVLKWGLCMACMQNDPVDGKSGELGVQEDTAQAVPGIADAAAAHPPGFESAARAEHASEAQAIRNLLSQPVRFSTSFSVTSVFLQFRVIFIDPPILPTSSSGASQGGGPAGAPSHQLLCDHQLLALHKLWASFF